MFHATVLFVGGRLLWKRLQILLLCLLHVGGLGTARWVAVMWKNSLSLTGGQRAKGIYPRPCDLHKCYHVAGSFQETIFCNPILVVGTPSPSVYLNRGRPGNDASSSSHKLLVNKIKGLVLFFFPTDLGQRHQGDPHVDTGRGWDQRVSCISHKSRKQFRKFLDDYWSAMGRSCGSCGSSSQVGSKIW